MNCTAQFHPGSDAALAELDMYIKINKYKPSRKASRAIRMISMRQNLWHDDSILSDSLKYNMQRAKIDTETLSRKG